jgi:hypothetical protein
MGRDAAGSAMRRLRVTFDMACVHRIVGHFESCDGVNRLCHGIVAVVGRVANAPLDKITHGTYPHLHIWKHVVGKSNVERRNAYQDPILCDEWATESS